jgi:hypothetical protein
MTTDFRICDDCRAPAAEGTAYCVLHLGLRRAQRIADLFPDEDTKDCAAVTCEDMERLGQLTLMEPAA